MSDVWKKNKEIGILNNFYSRRNIFFLFSPDRTRLLINTIRGNCSSCLVYDLRGFVVSGFSTFKTLYNWIDNNTVVQSFSGPSSFYFIQVWDLEKETKNTIAKIKVDMKNIFDRPKIQVVDTCVYYNIHKTLNRYDTSTGRSSEIMDVPFITFHTESTFSVCPKHKWICFNVTDISRHFDFFYLSICSMRTGNKIKTIQFKNIFQYARIKTMCWSPAGTHVLLSTNNGDYTANTICVWNVCTNKSVLKCTGYRSFALNWSPCARFICCKKKNSITIREASTLNVHSKLKGVHAQWLSDTRTPSLLTFNYNPLPAFTGKVRWFTYPHIRECRVLLMAIFSGVLRPKTLYNDELKYLLMFFKTNIGLLKLVGGAICSYIPFQHNTHNVSTDSNAEDSVVFSNIF